MNASTKQALRDDVGLSFDDAALGRGLAPEVEALMTRAGSLRHAPEDAQALLLEACAMAPLHPAPLIALYRFHFYGHRLSEARLVARDALEISRKALGPAFGEQPPSDDDARFNAAVRFHLFSLKGHAYLSMRLGDFESARADLEELRRLDVEDRVGGAVLAQVLARKDLDPDDVAFDATPLSPRGWGSMERAS